MDFGVLVGLALLIQGLLLVCYFAGPVGPPAPEAPNHAVNINYVFGMNDAKAQTMMAPGWWLLSLMAVNVFLFHIPTPFALNRALWRASCWLANRNCERPPSPRLRRSRRLEGWCGSDCSVFAEVADAARPVFKQTGRDALLDLDGDFSVKRGKETKTITLGGCAG
jgi:hypothetical protein